MKSKSNSQTKTAYAYEEIISEFKKDIYFYIPERWFFKHQRIWTTKKKESLKELVPYYPIFRSLLDDDHMACVCDFDFDSRHEQMKITLIAVYNIYTKVAEPFVYIKLNNKTDNLFLETVITVSKNHKPNVCGARILKFINEYTIPFYFEGQS